MTSVTIFVTPASVKMRQIVTVTVTVSIVYRSGTRNSHMFLLSFYVTVTKAVLVERMKKNVQLLLIQKLSVDMLIQKKLFLFITTQDVHQ